VTTAKARNGYAGLVTPSVITAMTTAKSMSTQGVATRTRADIPCWLRAYSAML
jgi:hypothetical protein